MGWWNTLADLPSILTISPAVQPIVLGVAALIGLALCLVGRKIMRPIMSIQGVLIGGLVGLALVGHRPDKTMVVAIIAGCCAIGFIAAWLMFRVWMGLALGLLLAMLLPMVGLAFRDQHRPQYQRPPVQEIVAEHITKLSETGGPASRPAASLSDGQGPATTMPARAVPVPDAIQRQAERIRAHVKRMGEEIIVDARDGWGRLSPAGQYTVVFGVGVGGIIGLVIGLLAPYFTASVLSSVVGACLIVLSVAHIDHPRIDRFADSPALMLTAGGLITIMGVLLQWTFFHKKADK